MVSLSEDEVLHASDRLEAGWLVVKSQWFKLVTVDRQLRISTLRKSKKKKEKTEMVPFCKS